MEDAGIHTAKIFQSNFVGKNTLKGGNVWELGRVGVAVWGSRSVRESQCVGVAFLVSFTCSPITEKNKTFKKFTAAKRLP